MTFKKLGFISLLVLVIWWFWSNGSDTTDYDSKVKVQNQKSSQKVTSNSTRNLKKLSIKSGMGVEFSDLLPDSQRETYFGARRPLTVPSYRRKEVSQQCHTFFAELRALNLSVHANQFDFFSNLPSQQQCKNLPPRFQKLEKTFSKKCSNGSQQQGDCFRNLVFYRAEITDWITRDVSTHRIDDPKVLFDKAIARFRSDPIAASEFAERALEFEPNSYSLARIVFLGRQSEAIWKANLAPEDPAWRRVDQALEQVRLAEREHTDQTEEIAIMEIMSEMRAHAPEKIRELAEEATSRFKNSGIGPYFLALLAYKSGDRNEAFDQLNLAIRREPHEYRYYNTLVSMLETPLGDEPMAKVFSINFEILSKRLVH